MAVLRAIARPMLASIFIVQGYDTLRRPERVVKKAEPIVRPLAKRIPAVPDDTEQAVRLNGAVQLVGGTLLAVGWVPRLAALAIAGSLVPTTAAGHRFWEVSDEQERAQQRIHFLKNVVMFGGLLIAAGDTAGRPSLAWRSRHAVKAVRHDMAAAAKSARKTGKAGQAKAGQVKAVRANAVRAKAARAKAVPAKAVPAKAARAKAVHAKAGPARTGRVGHLRPAG